MRVYDIISTIFFMMLGVYIFVNGWRFGFGSWKDPGPGFIPVLSGLLIFCLSVLWLVMTLVRKWGIEPAKRFIAEGGSYKKVIITLLGLVVFVLLLDKTGFIVSTFIFLILLFRAIEPLRWRLILILTSVVTIFCVVVFQLWLQIQLPEGLFNIYLIKKWIYSINR